MAIITESEYAARLDERKQARLASLMRYRSRYEVVMDRHDVGMVEAERYRLGYTARKSKRGMADLICAKGIELARRLPNGVESRFLYERGNVMTMCGWRVTFGRTEREAVMEGELPSYRELPVLCDLQTEAAD